jgi:hypothetical protein
VVYLAIKKTSTVTSSLIISICLAILTIVYLRQYYPHSVEKFVDDPNYNEDIKPIESGMTIYNTAFSKLSYPTKTIQWYNMASFFANNACPDTRLSDTHLYFRNIPSYSKEKGFYLLNNPIKGPMSFQMGINANESFTIFFTMKFDMATAGKTERDIDLINLYANTINNNGLSLSISKNIELYNASDKLNIKSNLNMAFGEHKMTKEFIINNAYTYLFVIVKDNLNIKLYAYPNIDSLSVSSNDYVTVLEFNIDPETDVLLSNKEMQINRYGNTTAYLYNFGVYNYALTQPYIANVYTHIQAELHKFNFVVKEFSNIIQTLEEQKMNAMKCPYDSNVCDKCTSIKDWTNMIDIVSNATDECLTSINEFCIKNPTHEQCVCWNPANVQSKTIMCKKYISLFDTKNEKQIIDEIKQEYDLCPCSSVQNQNNQEQITNKQLIIPNMIHKAYDNSKSDIELYNDIVI